MPQQQPDIASIVSLFNQIQPHLKHVRRSEPQQAQSISSILQNLKPHIENLKAAQQEQAKPPPKKHKKGMTAEQAILLTKKKVARKCKQMRTQTEIDQFWQKHKNQYSRIHRKIKARMDRATKARDKDKMRKLKQDLKQFYREFHRLEKSIAGCAFQHRLTNPSVADPASF